MEELDVSDMVPGQAKACLDEVKAREGLAESIRVALGQEPTRLEPGSGIRGKLSEILDKLDEMAKKIDARPTAQGSLAKRIGLILFILALAIGDIRWAYQQIRASSAGSQTSGKIP
jgi:hypothetical protein